MSHIIGMTMTRCYPSRQEEHLHVHLEGQENCHETYSTTKAAKINTLSNVLKKCEFDKTRLEAMFSKRQTQRKPHVSHASHADTQSHSHHATRTIHAHVSHAHHALTHHAFLYGKVYTCTYYDRKGHLVKFCYDRINASNNHIWVQKTNILGSKKVWVSKSINLLLNIGMHQGSKT